MDINDFLTPAVAEKKKFEHLIDDSIATCLEQAIRVLLDQAEFILAAEQGPTDYLPEDGSSQDISPTQVLRQFFSSIILFISIQVSLTKVF